MHLRERLGSEKLKLMHVLVHRQQRQVAARHCHLLSSPAAAGLILLLLLLLQLRLSCSAII